MLFHFVTSLGVCSDFYYIPQYFFSWWMVLHQQQEEVAGTVFHIPPPTYFIKEIMMHGTNSLKGTFMTLTRLPINHAHVVD
jgi:hypothetical protein